MESNNLTVADYVAMEEVKHQHRDGWGSTTALWVIAAIILIVAIVYNWTKNCNEKVAFATGLSDLRGRVDCMAPQVGKLNDQMYGAAQAFAGLTVGLSETRRDFSTQLGQLNNTVFYNPANEGWFIGNRNNPNCSGCCGSPSRVFAQTSTYAQTGTPQVTVTESCANDRC